MHARVRQGYVIILVPDAAKIQKIHIEHTGFVPDHPDTPEFRLDAVQTLQGVMHGQRGAGSDDGIDEPWLVGQRYRSGLEPAGYVDDFDADLGQARDRRFAATARCCEPVRNQIGADADQDIG